MNHGCNENKIVMKFVNKISNLVNSLKYVIVNVENKDDVYRISCNNCKNVSVGHMEITVKKRIYFHKTNLNVGTKTGTSLPQHLLKNKRNVNW